MKTEQITIYPSKDLEKKLEKAAKRQKRSMNNFILFILENALAKREV